MLTGLGKWSVLKLAVNYSVSTMNAAEGKENTQQPSRSASIFLSQTPSWRKSKSFFDLTSLFTIYYNSGSISFSLSSMMLLAHTNKFCYEKRINFLFFSSACLSQPFLCAFAKEAFPLSEFPPFWQGCSAGVIWSVTVTRVMWCATDVEANTVPLLCSGKCMCQEQQQDGGFHISCSLPQDTAKIPTPVWCTGSQLEHPSKKSNYF